MAMDNTGYSVIQQWVSTVNDFSSQYGSENSISYSMYNMAGESSVYPSYGDFTKASVLRTYDTWWKTCPSAVQQLDKRPKPRKNEDYVNLSFEVKVFPEQIDIFETYNPGTIVRILACDTHPSEIECGVTNNVKWFELWSGEPKGGSLTHEARKFSPPIKTPLFPTNYLQVEFHSVGVDYYTEIDAVRMTGSQLPPPGTIVAAVEQFQPIIQESHISICETDQTDRDNSAENSVKATPLLECEKSTKNSADTIAKELAELHLLDGISAALAHSDNGLFDRLPEEVLQLIVDYLTLPSLCALSQTSRLFYKHCYDYHQYTNLDLQPFWTKVTAQALHGIQSRCDHIISLDFSWCGNMKLVSQASFLNFLKMCGQHLTVLRLACCHFLDAGSVSNIVKSCPQLEEVDLQCNKRIDSKGFLHLALLTRLRRLNLYRTSIDIYSLIAIVRMCSQLEHLNVGSCTSVNDFDDVAIQLGENCTKLKSIDMWRARTLSSVGVHALASGCPELEEVDIGWCSSVESSSGCLQYLAQSCKNLKKLFLTANRTVCDADLIALSEYCQSMEQIDVLGTREVSATSVLALIQKCPHLVFFDLSFCSGIENEEIIDWRHQYPRVAIKRSYQI